MIKYQSTDNKVKLMAAVAVAAVFVGGVVWWASGDRAVDDSVKVADPASGQGLWPTAGVGDGPTSSLPASGPSLADARPDGVGPEDWETLQAVMARMGQSKEDARKLVGLVRYQRDFEKMQVLDQEKDALARKRMAESLMAELPARVKDGEFSMMESAFMGAALIAELEQDDNKRTAQLAKWQADMIMLVPQADSEVAIAKLTRETEFKRRLAGAYMDWEVQTDAAQRTPAKLEQAMEATRREFNSAPR
jgi:hypothetical protein